MPSPSRRLRRQSPLIRQSRAIQIGIQYCYPVQVSKESPLVEHGRGLMVQGPPRYGEQPLTQTVAAAGALRRLTGLLLSLEHEHPTVAAMLTQIAGWEGELASAVAPDPTPRIGEGG